LAKRGSPTANSFVSNFQRANAAMQRGIDCSTIAKAIPQLFLAARAIEVFACFVGSGTKAIGFNSALLGKATIGIPQ
jgi:hypothetical protein